ncbi:hypothetical protein [Martelella limonii]|nr:hypothetical protein [Martelella limonii]
MNARFDWLGWPGTLTVASAVPDIDTAMALSKEAGAPVERRS